MANIDPLQDHLISLKEASTLIPGKPHLRTVWRWVLDGIDGHRLETVRVGRFRFTTREAVAEFLRRLNDPKSNELPRYLRAKKSRKRLKEELGIRAQAIVSRVSAITPVR
jgi:hypothetical protein